MRVFSSFCRVGLFVLVPGLKQLEVKSASRSNVFNKFRNMRFALKLGICSLGALVFMIVVGYIMFPKMIKGKIKGMVNLKPGTEIRDMFLKVPFPLSFKVYIFTVVNPDEVDNGAKPRLKQVGPFCYEEWKTKINVEDYDSDDSISYDPVDTFLPAKDPECVDPSQEVTLPHPLILGMVNTVSRQKPGAITLANKAIKSIWSNPSSLFVTVKAGDLLFDGVVIHCGVTDFAGKAICTTLKAEPSLVHLGEDDLAFSLLGPKNGTPGKRIKARRGSRDYHSVGKILTFDGAQRLQVWNDSKCDAILGTDGTIFPPFLKRSEGLASFAPDLCRSLIAQYNEHTSYDGIPVNAYSATLGDQSVNRDEKCFCTTPDTCMKKGLMDLYKCAKIPIYASLPHFYNAHESYLKGVQGLKPDPEKHAIKILFESLTGSPLYAMKRLQFNMPLEPNPKLDLFRNFTPTVIPLFWVEEGVELNRTYTKPLKDLFLLKKIVLIMEYLVMAASILGLAASIFLYIQTTDSEDFSSVKKVHPNEGTKNGISTVFDGTDVDGTTNGYVDKY